MNQAAGQNIDKDAPLMEAGIDSIAASELVQQLQSQFDMEVSATLLFDHPSVSSIASYLAPDVQGDVVEQASGAL